MRETHSICLLSFGRRELGRCVIERLTQLDLARAHPINRIDEMVVLHICVFQLGSERGDRRLQTERLV